VTGDPAVTVVTGGAQGIGRAVVDWCLAHGHAVASLDLESHEIEGALALRCDVASQDAVVSAFRDVERELGPVHGLVNNAGRNAYFDAATMTGQDWDDVLAVDLKAAWYCARAVLPGQRRMGRGSIVNVSSMHSSVSLPGMFPYAAVKAGLDGLTRSLALDEGPHGIRVNAVAPGFTRTRLVTEWLHRQSDPQAAEHEVTCRIPLRRFVEPAEVAQVIGFLLSDASAGMTGAVVPIDGGHSVRMAT
jgi:NAD(P)-dependent dehydrogenase (short-subunit alcohol dehydrogenase family)